MVKWLEQKQKLDIIYEKEGEDMINARKRKLILKIEKAIGLSNSSSTFVYYSFQGIDYLTPTT